MNHGMKTEIDAAAFRTLVGHFWERSDAQNIDMMELLGSCRNCPLKWHHAEAEARGETLIYEDAREIIYSLPHAE